MKIWNYTSEKEKPSLDKTMTIPSWKHHKLEQNKFREGHTQHFPNLATSEEASFFSLASEFTILFLALGVHKKQLRNADNITKGDIPGYVGLRGYSSAAVVDTTHYSFI